MKVLVTLVAEVDPAKWRAEYGSLESSDEIRQAIRGMVVEAARDAVRYLPVKVDPAYVPSGRMGA